MARALLTTEQILDQLTEHPHAIAALTAGLAPARLHRRPDATEWSANDVLAHLRACADVWGRCITTMLTQEAPTIRAINPRAWIKQTDYPDQSFAPSLQAFTAQREALLATLQPLAPNDWERTATMRGAGAAQVRTVRSYAQRLAEHERIHLAQLQRLVGTAGR